MGHVELWTSQNGQTALIKAAAFGRHDVAGLLLDRGADMEAKDDVSRLASLPSAEMHGRAGCGSWARHGSMGGWGAAHIGIPRLSDSGRHVGDDGCVVDGRGAG